MQPTLPKEKHLFCPHLGRRSDPTSAIDHPSPRNYCYRAKNLAGPSLMHQENLCLTKRYTQCPVYFREGTHPFPKELLRTTIGPLARIRYALADFLRRLMDHLRD